MQKHLKKVHQDKGPSLVITQADPIPAKSEFQLAQMDEESCDGLYGEDLEFIKTEYKEAPEEDDSLEDYDMQARSEEDEVGYPMKFEGNGCGKQNRTKVTYLDF